MSTSRSGAAAICCGFSGQRHLGAERLALIYQDAVGAISHYTFEQLHDLSCRFANALQSLGVARGDRVAILLPQAPETLVAHLAIYRMGAVALPLFSLFGPEAIDYRLRNREACVLVTDDAGLAKIEPIWPDLRGLRAIVDIDGSRGARVPGFGDLIDWGRETFEVGINELYGQTECNLVIGHCSTLMPTRNGSMGRAIPGHEVAIIDDDGARGPPGTPGSIAVRAPDPVMFL